ncbi:cell division protein FtsA [Candidatus Tachikawaea gelatinosa]|uniref:Cell division protein FtsA n=1 Tax=Candidatus Tachikawaea gelatinosa TaxID=1410383 RepID=A0A090AJ45_9ENTR|nr:cell division protein FtsA [Candidatus Tachikawaea gelatinosa]BAP58458.1 cell division protein ftsA [Candidatus Tachikawaea gelatinosa]
MIKVINKKLIVGLEIGTTKISVLIGEILPDSTMNIIGIGNCLSQGIDKGDVNNLELVVKSIKKSINQAEKIANCQISSVYLAFSHKKINIQNEIGIVPLYEKEVTQNDINNVVHTAKSVRIKDKHRILHVIPQEYKIDSQSGIKNPLGLSGIRMQAKVHLITCHNDIIKNMVKAVERCNVNVDAVIFSGLSSSLSVLTEDEKELGVCLVDIGGGTIDLSVYVNGILYHNKVIPYAGKTVTSDISYAFGISYNDAEKIKIRYGSALKSIIEKDEDIEITDIGHNFSKKLHIQTLAEIIEPRYIELLNLVKIEIMQLQTWLHQNDIICNFSAGIVLTGGGSNIKGLTDCAQHVFNLPTRIGKPINITGLTDEIKNTNFSTAVGLLLYGKESFLKKKSIKKNHNAFYNFFKKISNWIKKEF